MRKRDLTSRAATKENRKENATKEIREAEEKKEVRKEGNCQEANDNK